MVPRQWCQGCSQTREVKRREGEGLLAEEEGQLDRKEKREAMEMFYKKMALIEEAVEKQVIAGNCPEAGTKEESSEPGSHKRKKKGGKGSRLRRL